MSHVLHHDEHPSGLARGILVRMAQVAFSILLLALFLFLSSGDTAWAWAWVYLGLNLVGVAVNAATLFRYSPETIARRGESEGMKDWDKAVGGAWGLAYFILVPLVAGLDHRLGWTGAVSLAVHLAGAVLFSLGFALFSWAMVTNAHFSTVVRVQSEEGQTVCTAGPYRAVRHPGYVGAIGQSLGAPLLLGSGWALIPGIVAAALMVLRTALEDRTLQQELAGYAEYARAVRHRLLPGVW